MPGISTRWEWRIFGPGLSAAQSWLAAHQSTGIQESDEIYFLSASGAIVKLRSNLMDIKLLREVDSDGLERWEPVMKAAFPLQEPDGATRKSQSSNSATTFAASALASLRSPEL